MGARTPRTLAFDVYGTLVDTTRMAIRVAPSLGAAWRRHQLEITWLLSLMERYEDFDAVSEHALDLALAEQEIALSPEERRSLLDGLALLPAYEDAGPALERLAVAGIELAVLSNGSPRMLEAVLRNAGILERFRTVVSADEVGVYKPSPRVYRHGAERLDVPIESVWLVSGNPFDCAGAKAAGLGVAKIERRPSPDYPFAAAPDLVVGSLAELADALAA